MKKNERTSTSAAEPKSPAGNVRTIDVTSIARTCGVINLSNTIVFVYCISVAFGYLTDFLQSRFEEVDVGGLPVLILVPLTAWIAWKNRTVLSTVLQPFTITCLLLVAIFCGAEAASTLRMSSTVEFQSHGAWLCVYSLLGVIGAVAVVRLRQQRIAVLGLGLREIMQALQSSGQVRRRMKVRSRDIAAGLALLALCAISLFAAVLVLRALAQQGSMLPTDSSLPASGGGYVVGLIFAAVLGYLDISVLAAVYLRILGAAFFQMARAQFQPTAETLLRDDPRKPVLLLRSFADSKQSRVDYSFLDFSLESRLVESFSGIGPLVSVRAPHQRILVGDVPVITIGENWGDRVVGWMDSSQVILVMAGLTEGVSWELRQIIIRGLVNKLILFFPQIKHSETGRESRIDYEKDVAARIEHVRKIFSGTPWEPALAALSSFRNVKGIVFAEDGGITAIVSRSRKRSAHHLAIIVAHHVLRRGAVPHGQPLEHGAIPSARPRMRFLQIPAFQIPISWLGTAAVVICFTPLVWLRWSDSKDQQMRLEIAADRRAIQQPGLTLKDRAMLELDTGDKLYDMSEHESGTAQSVHLQEVVVACQSALQGLTPTTAPDDWAQAQQILGNALYDLGKSDTGSDGAKRLQGAVAAYRAALPILTRADSTHDWARLQFKLGLALSTLGYRDSGTTGTNNLQDAVTAYQAALDANGRTGAPDGWAEPQLQLGLALQELGERNLGPEGLAWLQRAVAAYRIALQVRTDADESFDWIQVHANLASVLHQLGEREFGPEGVAYLQESVLMYGIALQEQSQEQATSDWADISNRWCYAMSELAERAPEAARLDDAVDACRAALKIFDSMKLSEQLANTQDSLGYAQTLLAQQNSGTEGLQDALVRFQAAIQVLTHEKTPLTWALVQKHRGRALTMLGERTSDPGLLKQAVAAFTLALTVPLYSAAMAEIESDRERAEAALSSLGARYAPLQ